MTVARIFGFLSLTLQAADWLNEGGQHNFQPLERELTPASVPGLKLIWKRKLGDGAVRLSSPVIMGRLITYRGTVELVFVNSSDGHVYAVDGDSGKIFWTRRFESAAGAAPVKCSEAATPALTPNPADVDPDDDGPQPRRPLFVLASDGLHTLNPIDGKDDRPPARRAFCAGALVVRKGKAERLRASRDAIWKDAFGVRHRFDGAVVAGGVAFALDPSSGELQAFDALARRPLYRSGPIAATASSLAVANGHVCFTASDGTLYCFGFPLDG